jgi:hypothetical protein
MDLKNHYFNAHVIKKSFKSELLTTAIKNFEKELADQVQLNQKVELAVDLYLK